MPTQTVPTQEAVSKRTARLLASDSVKDLAKAAKASDCPREQLTAWLAAEEHLAAWIAGIRYEKHEIHLAAWSNPTLTREDYLLGVSILNAESDGRKNEVYKGLQVNTGMPLSLIRRVKNMRFRIRHLNYPHEEHLKIAQSNNVYNKRCLAEIRWLSEDIQFILSQDENPLVRKNLAQNHSVTNAVIAQWWGRETKPYIIRSLIILPGSVDLREEMLNRLEDISTAAGERRNRNPKVRYTSDVAYLDEAAKTFPPTLAKAALRNRHTSEGTLTEIAIDERNGVLRRIAAMHPNCSDEGIISEYLMRCGCGESDCKKGCNLKYTGI